MGDKTLDNLDFFSKLAYPDRVNKLSEIKHCLPRVKKLFLTPRQIYVFFALIRADTKVIRCADLCEVDPSWSYAERMHQFDLAYDKLKVKRVVDQLDTWLYRKLSDQERFAVLSLIQKQNQLNWKLMYSV